MMGSANLAATAGPGLLSSGTWTWAVNTGGRDMGSAVGAVRTAGVIMHRCGTALDT